MPESDWDFFGMVAALAFGTIAIVFNRPYADYIISMWKSMFPEMQESRDALRAVLVLIGLGFLAFGLSELLGRPD